MERKFTGKNVLITGAAGGIGRAAAVKFASKGANLILCDINKHRLECVEQEIKKQNKEVEILELQLDVTSIGEIKKAVQLIAQNWAHIDILVNCAGIGNAGKIVDTSEVVWDKVMSVNLKSVFLLSREVAKHMIACGIQGAILSISSQNSKIAEYANGVYSCSKSAINTLTQVMAQELAEYKINVNCVCPGYVNTEMMQKAFRERGPIEGMTPEEYEKNLCGEVPLGRMAEPEDIANVLTFLASEEASYITGIALTVAGGKTLI